MPKNLHIPILLLWIIGTFHFDTELAAQEYNDGSFNSKDETEFVFTNAYIDGGNLHFKHPGMNDYFKIRLSEIDYIRYRKGTYVGTGAIIGGGAGILLGISISLSNDSNSQRVPSFLELVGLGGGIGILTGGFLGVTIPKYERVYNPGYDTSSEHSIGIGLTPEGIGITYIF